MGSIPLLQTNVWQDKEYICRRQRGSWKDPLLRVFDQWHFSPTRSSQVESNIGQVRVGKRMIGGRQL